jgi:polyhydroxybutyrate depolymerase
MKFPLPPIRQRWIRLLVGVVILALFTPVGSHAGDVFINLGRGPVRVYVPSSYDPDNPIPLIILLHGYGGSGVGQENYMRFAPLAEEYGFLYAHPDGTVDQGGYRFWNATDACCNFFGSSVDDSGYLLGLVHAIQAQLSVDPDRIHFAGHSNGGFMSYRMACDHSETVAAIASLAGATWFNPVACSPSGPVNVLQIHGTNDNVIRYNGGQINGVPYPGAIASTEQWAEFGECDPDPDTNFPPLDLDSSIPGAESTVRRYVENCAPGGSGELWSIVGGSHSPNLSPSFSRLVVEYLLAHAKPSPTDVPEPLPREVAFSLHAWPVPFTSGCWIELRGTDGGEELLNARIELIDSGGRRVATFAAGGRDNGGDDFGSTTAASRAFWDGRLEDGSSAPPGVYLARLVGVADTPSTKLVRVP